jgi:hypothetical protein
MAEKCKFKGKNFSVNILNKDLSNDATFNPPIFSSLVNNFKIGITEKISNQRLHKKFLNVTENLRLFAASVQEEIRDLYLAGIG